MTWYIVPIVEGQTEQRCVERLLHRVWVELFGRSERLQVVEPFRGHRDKLVSEDGKMLTESVQKAYLKVMAKTKDNAEAGSVLLILLDAERDCPATLAPKLLGVARTSLPAAAPVVCVLAKQMTENWIVAGSSALAGVNGLPNSLQPPDDPEACNGAAWLDRQLRSVNKSRKYKKTADAPVFVASMNLQACRNTAPSFDKLCRDLETLLGAKPL